MPGELDKSTLERVVGQAIQEDIGTGDLTTDAVAAPEQEAEAFLLAKEDLVLAGLPVIKEVFRQIDEKIVLVTDRQDGDAISGGKEILGIKGPARGILKGERVALNFLQHLCGIATLTSKYVERVKPYKAKIVDTRKTIPGLRALEKYAVACGGAGNHRFGLFDGILIKENHLDLAGGIIPAVTAARSRNHHLLKIEVEIERPDQVEEAINSGAEVIMLDNMDHLQMTEAVKRIGGKALVEASGNMDPERAVLAAQAGVDLISVGALTHSAKAVDISLRFSSVSNNCFGSPFSRGDGL